MKLFESKLLNDTIVVLEEGDEVVGWLAAYSPLELKRIEEANLSREDKKKLHLFKKVFGLKESEWGFNESGPVRVSDRAGLQDLQPDSANLGIPQADD